MDNKITTLLLSDNPEDRKQGILLLKDSRELEALQILAAVYKREPDPEVKALAKQVGSHIKRQRETETTSFSDLLEQQPAADTIGQKPPPQPKRQGMEPVSKLHGASQQPSWENIAIIAVLVIGGVVALGLILAGINASNANSNPVSAQVQEFRDSVSPEREYIYYDLNNIAAGTTLYLYAESNEIDTWVGITDINQTRMVADNDDIDYENGNTNSALTYTFINAGDYSIFVSDCCRSDVTGAYRLLIGVDAPNVLTGNAAPTGAEIAVPFN